MCVHISKLVMPEQLVRGREQASVGERAGGRDDRAGENVGVAYLAPLLEDALHPAGFWLLYSGWRLANVAGNSPLFFLVGGSCPLETPNGRGTALWASPLCSSVHSMLVCVSCQPRMSTRCARVPPIPYSAPDRLPAGVALFARYRTTRTSLCIPSTALRNAPRPGAVDSPSSTHPGLRSSIAHRSASSRDIA